MFPGEGEREWGLYFFCMRRLAPSIYLSPPKISGILSTQKIFYPSLRIHENIRVPPPPTPTPRGVFLHSYTRCPSESDKTGVMKIATKERDIDNDVIVYIVIGDSIDSLNISVISGYLVYLYTLTVFHRKLTFYCEKNVTGVTIHG